MPYSQKYESAPPPAKSALLRKFSTLPDEFIADAIHDARQLYVLNAPHIRQPIAWQNKIAYRTLKREQDRRSRFVPLDKCAEIPAPEKNTFEVNDLVKYFLSILPPVLQDTVRLHWIEEKTHEEIAEILNEKTETIKKRCVRGMERMREVAGRSWG